MAVHVIGFIAIIGVLWALSPHVSAAEVFTSAGWEQSGSWNSLGTSLMVGQISAVYALICSDSAAHMAEEVRDSGIAVPQAMIRSYMVNGFIGTIFLITFLFSIPSVTDAVNDPSGFPFLYVFQQAMPVAGTQILTTVILIVFFGGNVSINASTARQTFAFARDNGLPFSSWIGKVHSTRMVPANAIWLSFGISIILVS
jgi:choline transport protein